MIWFTWRQHRGEAVGLAAMLTVLGGVALVTGLPMYSAYDGDGIAACQQAGAGTETCRQLLDSFRDRFAGIPAQAAGQLNLLPLVVGILVGAPLLAREYEQGTWQLAWTQAVPRTRWAIAKVGLVLAAVIAAAIVLSVVLQWWLRPLFPAAFSVERFNYAAPVLSGYFVLAVTTGILAGALIKRTLPAMVATLAVFLPIRLAVEFWLRPRYMTPVTVVDPVPGSSAVTEQVLQGGNWVLDNYLVGPSGRRLSDADEFRLLGGGSVDEATLVQHGLKEAVTYHPASRYWDFQLIEAAIFGGLALAFALLVIWRIRHWT
jgi:hypothetical protein